MMLLFRKIKNRTVAFIVDFLCIPLAWYGAYFLYQDSSILGAMLFAAPLLLVFQTGSLLLFKLYQGIWRFASLSDLIRIIVAVSMGTAFAILMINVGLSPLPMRVIIIYALLLTGFLSGFRIFARIIRDLSSFSTYRQRVLVVGAGSAGETIVRELLRSADKKFKPVCFVDDDNTHIGKSIHGVSVLGSLNDIPKLVNKFNIELIFIAIPSASAQLMRKIVNVCEEANVPFRTLPSVAELTEGSLDISTLRHVKIEDLLGREQVELSWQKIDSNIANKIILISGGGGSIGSELCRQISARSPEKLIIVDNNEFNLYQIDLELRQKFPSINLICLLADLNDKSLLNNIFQTHMPDIVFHAAAYKHVPLLENQIRVAIYNNIIGSKNIAEISSKYNVKKFILISSDKAVNPSNIMGATKRAAEIFCQNFNFRSKTKFITVRFGNVLDSAGSVVPLFRKQLREGKPLTVTHPDVTRYFMTIPEASQLILQAATMGDGGEIFVLDMGNPIKISYLAEQLIKLSGKVLGKDAYIEFVGLRPGEKLYEELFYELEKLILTPHTKIFQAEVQRFNWDDLSKIIYEMEYLCVNCDHEKLLLLLSKLVTEYKTPTETKVRNGRFEMDVVGDKV